MNIEIEYEGIQFECEYDYVEAQKETEIDPPFSAAAYLFRVYVVGTQYDLLDVLSVGTVQALEEKIEEAHQ
jgi:hypothetical protein